jgi:hypothetical protein
VSRFGPYVIHVEAGSASARATNCDMSFGPLSYEFGHRLRLSNQVQSIGSRNEQGVCRAAVGSPDTRKRVAGARANV